MTVSVLEKLDYLTENSIGTILLQASIFNRSKQLLEIDRGRYAHVRRSDLIQLDPLISSDIELNDFLQTLADHSRYDI